MSTFIIPKTIYHGLGSLQNLKEIKGKSAVIITGGNSMKRSGILDKVENILKSNNILVEIIDGIEPDPSIESVMNGVKILQNKQPNILIGLGGCSAIDAAKAMWVFYEYPETKFEDIITPFTIKPLRKKAIFVAIPSTSGTGTEVTCASVITDRKKGLKYPIISYELTPDIAIVDGEICESMPPEVTAHTGLDALAHNVEAFASIMSNNYTDALVTKSVQLIFENLPLAYKDGKNLNSRQAMHDASCLAGMAFTNAFLGIIHAMAHQLGAIFGIPHGCATALLMPNVIRYNSKSTNKYESLAKLLKKENAEEFAIEIEKLCFGIGIPASIHAYGINEKNWLEKIDVIAQNALLDPCAGTNPRNATMPEIKKILEYCYSGVKVDF
jgi:alcohol dehydrogenase class IV